MARSAVADIGRIEELAATDEPITSLYRPLESPDGIVRLKLFSSGGVLAFGGAADVRAPRREGRRRAPVRDHARGPRPGVDLRLRPPGRRREHRAGPRPVPRRVPRRVAGRARGRRPQRARARRDPDRAAGLDHPRDRQVPAPGRHRLLGLLHRADADSATPTSPGCWSGCSTRGSIPTARDEDAAERLGRDDRGGARRRPQPRRGPDPAQLPVASCGRSCAPTTSSPAPDGKPHPYLSFKLDSVADPGAAAAEAAVRDLRLLAARRGRPPARRQGRPRRPALVGPAARTSAPRSSA